MLLEDRLVNLSLLMAPEHGKNGLQIIMDDMRCNRWSPEDALPELLKMFTDEAQVNWP